MFNRITCRLGTFVIVLIAFLTLSKNSMAASLSGALSESDLGEVNRLVVMPSSHRSWTAHALIPEGALGLQVGVETAFVLRRNLLGLGDGRGVGPSIIPIPRFWTSVQLPMEIKLSGSVGVGGIFDGIQTYGLGTQWAFYKDSEKATSFTLDFRYSYMDVFGDLKANTMGLAAQASKDLVVWQPYAGAGFMVCNSTFNKEVLASGIKEGPHTTATYHMFVGVRVDLIAKLSVQLDVMAAKPSVGVLLEKNF